MRSPLPGQFQSATEYFVAHEATNMLSELTRIWGHVNYEGTLTNDIWNEDIVSLHLVHFVGLVREEWVRFAPAKCASFNCKVSIIRRCVGDVLHASQKY